jgi:hypothetical protein
MASASWRSFAPASRALIWPLSTCAIVGLITSPRGSGEVSHDRFDAGAESRADYAGQGLAGVA